MTAVLEPEAPEAAGATPQQRAAAAQAPPGVRGLLRAAQNWKEIRLTPYGVAPIALLALTGLFQQIDSSVFDAAGPDFVRRFGISITGIIYIQVVIGVFTIFALIGLGYVLDRRNRLRFVGIATCISGVGAFLTGWGRTTLKVGVPRVVDDTSNSASDVPLYSLVADYYPVPDRGKVFALQATLGRIATVVALPLGAFMVAHLGLLPTFKWLGVPIFVMGV